MVAGDPWGRKQWEKVGMGLEKGLPAAAGVQHNISCGQESWREGLGWESGQTSD